MAKVIWSLFLTGIFLGFGPCLLSCGPMLLAYIGGAKQSGLQGLKTYLVFSLSKIFIYACMGVLAGFFGEKIIHVFQAGIYLKSLFVVFGLFLLFVGFSIFAKKQTMFGKCSSFLRYFTEPGQMKNSAILGIFAALAPCLPLTAILGYIALISDRIYKGIIYMSAFGLGTVISPLILLSFGAGWAVGFFKRNELANRIIRFVSVFLLCFLGLNLIMGVFL